MADVKNIKIGGVTPDKRMTVYKGNAVEIKRTYKIAGGQAVIVWDIGEKQHEKTIVIYFASGYRSLSIPPLETIGHTGTITVKQGSALNNEIIGEFEYNSAETFYKSSLPTTKMTFVEICLPNITEIKDEAFKDNTRVIAFVATNSKITKLGNLSLGQATTMGTSKLSRVSLPDTVVSLGDECFQFSVSLQNFNFPANLKYIGNRCFHGSGLTGHISLPPLVETIGGLAFYECEKITSISIGSNIKNIKMNVNGSPFQNCLKLAKISVEENDYYKTENDRVLFTKAGTELIYYAVDATGTEYSIPETVQTIKNNAFAANRKLTTIHVPENVLTIEDHAFQVCASLTSIIIPNSVSDSNCGSGVFYGCTNLSSLSLPVTWLSIPSGLCRGCLALKSITLPSTIKKISSGAFEGSGLTEIVIPNSIQEIQSYAFADCKSLKTIRFNGTQEEWNNINLMRNWKKNTDTEIIYSL